LKTLATITLITISAFSFTASADPPTRYQVTKLTSDLSGAANLDLVLQNAWGVAFTPSGSPFWVADNATGCATLYDGVGVPQPSPSSPLRVKIPLPGGKIPASACVHNPASPSSPPSVAPAAPTGLVSNPTTTFLVPHTNSPATFIFDTEDGTISAWTAGLNPPDQAVLAVDKSPGAVYKGLAFGTNPKGIFLFATNFRAGTIDVFASDGSSGFRAATSQEIGNLIDPGIPNGFAPFGIQNIGGVLFVTYAKQDAEKHDDVAGQGNGFVDMFDTDGNLVKRFVTRGQLNSPWGVARASFTFGEFSGDILVGNFGDGTINAYDPATGNFRGTVRDVNNKPLVIDGLWTLTLGGGKNSNPNTLYLTAGPNGEADGLFGTITPIP
jgi:uncharacterized protein (TIGR03118 family)